MVCFSARDERSSEEEASDEGETPTGGQHLQCHGHLEQRDPASLGHHVRLRTSVLSKPEWTCCYSSVCLFVQEGNETGQRAVVAGTSSWCQRTCVESCNRQRAQHHTRYKHTDTTERSRLWEDIQFYSSLLISGRGSIPGCVRKCILCKTVAKSFVWVPSLRLLL